MKKKKSREKEEKQTWTTTSDESITLYSSPHIRLLWPFSNIVCRTRSLNPSPSTPSADVLASFFCSKASKELKEQKLIIIYNSKIKRKKSNKGKHIFYPFSLDSLYVQQLTCKPSNMQRHTNNRQMCNSIDQLTTIRIIIYLENHQLS